MAKGTKQNKKPGQEGTACKKKTITACPVCGSTFEGSGRQKYCGAKCRAKAIYQAQKQRKREEADQLDAQKVAAWKAEKEKHRGKHLCHCVMCFASFYSDSPHTLYCSPACMRIYGGKSMEWRSTK